MIQLNLAENYGDHEFQWQKEYGPLYRVKGCLGEDRLMVSDPQALKHLFNDPSITRPPSHLKIAHLVMGEKSVYCAEGERHRQLRAAMSIGLSARSVRDFLPIFIEVVQKLLHELEIRCSPNSSTRLNVGKMLDLATLDIICNAGLGSPVNAVQNPAHPLARSLVHVLESAFVRSKSSFMAEFFLAYIPTSLLRLALHLPFGPLPALLNFRTVTQDLMGAKARDFETDGAEKDDLLNIIFAGSSKTGLTPSDVLSQIVVLILAGQDTSAAVTSWAFYWLAQNPGFQHDLRQEISAKSKEYDNMPLLNALIKETLRMFPAGPLPERWASEDCVLPLSSEIVTSTGKRIRELPIRKGQYIYLAVGAYQRLESLWGPDADEFKPSRWLEGEPSTGQALGPYAQLSAFLGGHRFCPGWRFALLEMQVILTELLAKFSFSLPEHSVVRACTSPSQFAVDNEGVRGLWLCVEPNVH